jgi:hypothetical protein
MAPERPHMNPVRRDRWGNRILKLQALAQGRVFEFAALGERQRSARRSFSKTSIVDENGLHTEVNGMQRTRANAEARVEFWRALQRRQDEARARREAEQRAKERGEKLRRPTITAQAKTIVEDVQRIRAARNRVLGRGLEHTH